MKHPHLPFAALVLITSALGGCAGPDTPLEQAFCDGLQAPTEREVAAADAAETAPDVTAAGRVDITLNQTEDGYRGVVSYLPDEQGSFAFGLTADVDMVVRDAAGNEIAIEQTVQGAAACNELAVRYSVPLDTAAVTIELGPSETPVVGLIAEESDDDL